MNETSTNTETAATSTSSTDPASSASTSPALDFNTYLSALPETDREIFTKNGVDSFEKQISWVKGLNEIKGKKGLLKPAETATEAEKKAYQDALYKELGRPDDGKYDYELPEGSDDSFYSDEVINKLATVAFDNGMSAEGFQKLINTIAEPYNAMIKDWGVQVTKLKEKLGEDKIDDDSTNGSAVTKDSIHDEARTKRIEAEALHRKGDYKAATRLKAEADALYARLA